MPEPGGESLYPPAIITGPMRATTDQEPGWLRSGNATDGRTGLTAIPRGPNATLPPSTSVWTAISMAGLAGGLTWWARPTLKASRMQSKGGVWGWLQATIDAIQGFLDHGTNYIGHQVSKGAAHGAAAHARTLDLLALRWEQMTWNLAYFVHEVELVTGRLIHHIIPHEINKQTVPMRARIRRLRIGLATVTGDLNALRHWIHTQLNRHVYPRLGRVETKVNHTLPQRIRRGERVQARTNARQRADHRLIVKLLPLLTLAGGAALVLRSLPRLGLQYLTCRNVKDFGNEMCNSPGGAGRGLGTFWRRLFGAFGSLLPDLLALTFVPFLLTEACAIVGDIEQLAIKVQPFIDELVLSIEGFVCGGPSYLPSAIEPSDLARGAPLPSGL